MFPFSQLLACVEHCYSSQGASSLLNVNLFFVLLECGEFSVN